MFNLNFVGKEEEKSVLSTRFLELMNITSQNEDLLENVEQKNLDEYYNKMEKKEQLEEKMLTTFKIDCKAVKCIKVSCCIFKLILSDSNLSLNTISYIKYDSQKKSSITEHKLKTNHHL